MIFSPFQRAYREAANSHVVHGVVCIPAHLVEELAGEAAEMERFEAFVLEQVAAGSSIIGLYPATDPHTTVRYHAWLRARGEALPE